MIEVEIAYALTLGNITYASGTRLRVNPHVAGELIRDGRARLVDPADLGVLFDSDRTPTARNPFRGRIHLSG